MSYHARCVILLRTDGCCGRDQQYGHSTSSKHDSPYPYLDLMVRVAPAGDASNAAMADLDDDSVGAAKLAQTAPTGPAGHPSPIPPPQPFEAGALHFRLLFGCKR